MAKAKLKATVNVNVVKASRTRSGDGWIPKNEMVIDISKFELSMGHVLELPYYPMPSSRILRFCFQLSSTPGPVIHDP